MLGNHEHSHVGGPHTAKFYDDEAAVLDGEFRCPACEAAFSVRDGIPDLYGGRPVADTYNNATPSPRTRFKSILR